MTEQSQPDLFALTAQIVSAYVANSSVAAADVPGLIHAIHEALGRLGRPTVATVATTDDPKPAVPIKKSVTADHIVCLEDGKRFKSLKRHLRTHYNLSPEQYREKWGLPSDYPMVAQNYAAARSRLAKEMGLGTKREK